MDLENIIYNVVAILAIGMLILSIGSIIIKFIKYKKQLGMDWEDTSTTKKGWITTNGRFTGKINEQPGRITKAGIETYSYKEYEFEFFANEKMYKSWYTFYPMPEPEGIEENISVEVEYNKNRPWRCNIIKIKDWDLEN